MWGRDSRKARRSDNNATEGLYFYLSLRESPQREKKIKKKIIRIESRTVYSISIEKRFMHLAKVPFTLRSSYHVRAKTHARHP
jgi:hypothetical protein